jgi:hypothetical protein
MGEQETLDEIFGETPIWKNTYKIKWCELCRTAIIVCPVCKNTSCNGSGCKECNDEFDLFNKSKSCVEDYLTDSEIEAYNKAIYIKQFILKSLGRNETEIDFKRMKDAGELSELTEKMFSDRL